jgi:hypothetical protein
MTLLYGIVWIFFISFIGVIYITVIMGGTQSANKNLTDIPQSGAPQPQYGSQQSGTPQSGTQQPVIPPSSGFSGFLSGLFGQKKNPPATPITGATTGGKKKRSSAGKRKTKKSHKPRK